MTETTELIPIGKHPTEDQIELALITMAMRSGDRRRASEDLAAMGYQLAPNTLRGWVKGGRFEDRYRSIRERLLPQLREEAAERHSALADAQQAVGFEMTDKLRRVYNDIEPKDLPKSIQSLSIAMGVNRDKAAQAREGLQERPDLPDAQSILRALKAAGVTNIKLELVEDKDPPIDSTGEEVKPPSLPSAA